ncbi:hypothetical protein [Chitinilyticum litopenaei]|uniref:hypothetical protein n=1 Tax=Chitinilyticum litopenaei TaxID=1121276 RepID=UPI0003FE1710|nr:hypothetical protein [Chitinilyticum litopenaei]
MRRPVCVLVLGNAGLMLWQVRERTPVLLDRFLLDPSALPSSGIEGLRPWLPRLRAAVWHLLVDQLADEFRLEALPVLGRADRDALLQRRLQQQVSPYRSAQAAGRADGKPRYLLSALGRPALLDALLDALQAAGCALAGVHALADVLAGWRRRADGEADLLLGSIVPGQCRQACLSAGELVFSRQGPGAADGTDVRQVAALLAAELRQSRQYLAGQRLLPPTGVLQACVFAGASETEALQQALSAEITVAAEQIAVQVLAAETAGGWLAQAVLDIAAGRVSARHTPAGRLRTYRLRQLNRGLLITAGLVMLVAFAGAAVWQARTGQQEAGHDAVALASARQALQQARAGLAAYPGLDARHVAGAAWWHAQLAARPADPERAARELSVILLDYPELQIDALDWQLDQPFAATAVATPPAAAPQARDLPALPQGEYLLLDGRLLAGPADYRWGLARFESLLARLVAEGYGEPTVLRWPIDLRTEGQLEQPAVAAGQAHRFQLQIARLPGVRP